MPGTFCIFLLPYCAPLFSQMTKKLGKVLDIFLRIQKANCSNFLSISLFIQLTVNFIDISNVFRKLLFNSFSFINKYFYVENIMYFSAEKRIKQQDLCFGKTKIQAVHVYRFVNMFKVNLTGTNLGDRLFHIVHFINVFLDNLRIFSEFSFFILDFSNYFI